MLKPGDARATAALARLGSEAAPVSTAIFLTAGVEYDTNASYSDFDIESRDDVSGALGVRVEDQRSLFGAIIRTEFAGFANQHLSFQDANVMYAGAKSGPVFNLDEAWRVWVNAGAHYARLDGNYLFSGGQVEGRLENKRVAAFREAGFSMGYDAFRDVHEGRVPASPTS